MTLLLTTSTNSTTASTNSSSSSSSNSVSAVVGPSTASSSNGVKEAKSPYCFLKNSHGVITAVVNTNKLSAASSASVALMKKKTASVMSSTIKKKKNGIRRRKATPHSLAVLSHTRAQYPTLKSVHSIIESIVVDCGFVDDNMELIARYAMWTRMTFCLQKQQKSLSRLRYRKYPRPVPLPLVVSPPPPVPTQQQQQQQPSLKPPVPKPPLPTKSNLQRQMMMMMTIQNPTTSTTNTMTTATNTNFPRLANCTTNPASTTSTATSTIVATTTTTPTPTASFNSNVHHSLSLMSPQGGNFSNKMMLNSLQQHHHSKNSTPNFLYSTNLNHHMKKNTNHFSGSYNQYSMVSARAPLPAHLAHPPPHPSSIAGSSATSSSSSSLQNNNPLLFRRPVTNVKKKTKNQQQVELVKEPQNQTLLFPPHHDQQDSCIYPGRCDPMPSVKIENQGATIKNKKISLKKINTHWQSELVGGSEGSLKIRFTPKSKKKDYKKKQSKSSSKKTCTPMKRLSNLSSSRNNNNSSSKRNSYSLAPLATPQKIPCSQNEIGLNLGLAEGFYDVNTFNKKRVKRKASNCLYGVSASDLQKHVEQIRLEAQLIKYRRIQQLLIKLMEHPKNMHGIFNTPVDAEALNIPHYHLIIKKPMDLGTIRHRLESGFYSSLEDMNEDLRQVFKNAMEFNEAGNMIHVNARSLLGLVDDQWPSLEEKITIEANRTNKHKCEGCLRLTCLICQEKCKDLTIPQFTCSGGCDANMRKGNHIYSTRDGTRKWCTRCFNKLTKDVSSSSCANSKSEESEQQGRDMVTTRDLVNSSSSSGRKKKVLSPEETKRNVILLLQKGQIHRMKFENNVEGWIRCRCCRQWLHQICGLYNAMEMNTSASYVCPLCLMKKKRKLEERTAIQSVLKVVVDKVVELNSSQEEYLQMENLPLPLVNQQTSITWSPLVRKATTATEATTATTATKAAPSPSTAPPKADPVGTSTVVAGETSIKAQQKFSSNYDELTNLIHQHAFSENRHYQPHQRRELQLITSRLENKRIQLAATTKRKFKEELEGNTILPQSSSSALKKQKLNHPICIDLTADTPPPEVIDLTESSPEHTVSVPHHAKDKALPDLNLKEQIIEDDDNDDYLTEFEVHEAVNLAECGLSRFLEEQVRDRISRMSNENKNDILESQFVIRCVSNVEQKYFIPDAIQNVFSSSNIELPSYIPYTSKAIYLFQKHEGCDVCLFAMYVQEYHKLTTSNEKSVYIAYLDSVRYFKPARIRTLVYHHMVLGYLDYARTYGGYEKAHIWSCPPQRSVSYVFWCHPSYQKTPNVEHLRNWYSRMLKLGKELGIVEQWTTMSDRYFKSNATVETTTTSSTTATSSTNSNINTCNNNSNGNINKSTSTSKNCKMITRRSSSSEICNLSEKNEDEKDVWPAPVLAPLFEGDFWVAELERVINSKIQAQKLLLRKKRNASYCHRHDREDEVTIKLEHQNHQPAPSPSPPPIQIKLKDVYQNVLISLRNVKDDLIVVDLVKAASVSPEEKDFVKKQFESGCRFVGSRFAFHQLSAASGYQYDSLRRAKHSSMMLLYHLHLGWSNIPSKDNFCSLCGMLINTMTFWQCNQCPTHHQKGYALCDWCCKMEEAVQIGTNQVQVQHHPHILTFQPRPVQLPTRTIDEKQIIKQEQTIKKEPPQGLGGARCA